MSLHARYPGECVICGGDINVGDTIAPTKGGYAHTGCHETAHADSGRKFCWSSGVPFMEWDR